MIGAIKSIFIYHFCLLFCHHFSFTKGALRTRAGAAAYQPMPQAAFQAGTPVMMAPAYFNQTAPVMLVPAQNMQQIPGSAGGGLIHVQVPTNQVPSGATQVSAPSRVPEIATYPCGPQSSDEISVR